jgi:hypothetical protein
VRWAWEQNFAFFIICNISLHTVVYFPREWMPSWGPQGVEKHRKFRGISRAHAQRVISFIFWQFTLYWIAQIIIIIIVGLHVNLENMAIFERPCTMLLVCLRFKIKFVATIRLHKYFHNGGNFQMYDTWALAYNISCYLFE